MPEHLIKQIVGMALASDELQDKVVAGIAILSKYKDWNDYRLPIGSAHDVIAIKYTEVSEEDAGHLAELGWRKDDELESWAIFV